MSTTVFHGVVKQVLSGDTIVVRDRPIDGPPPEKTIVLASVSCGRVARKPTINNPGAGTEDPFAWEARELTRNKLIGKEVSYTVEKELPSGRVFGNVYLGKTINGENIALMLLEEGLGELRKLSPAAADKNPIYQQLLTAEESAKSKSTGRWSKTGSVEPRKIVWSIEDPRAFIEQYKGQRLPGVVEYVRDGSSMQITLPPSSAGCGTDAYYVIWISLSGVRAPTVRLGEGKQVAEPFGLDAQFFVESRLLHRDVIVLLESCLNQNFIGTILHPNGNIAEVLLREGLAKCIEWGLSMVSVPGATEAYHSAERVAKEKRLRLWEDYQLPPMTEPTVVHDPNRITPGTLFTGHIVEVGNGDNVTIKCSDGILRKFFLSSIRGPKSPAIVKNEEDGATRTRIRPLYDVPYVFESREHLRSFVGKPVTANVDYIQPKTATLVDERVCATVMCGATNIAESLVKKGLASVIQYRNANDSRSLSYAGLIAAKEMAQTENLGIFNKGDPPIHRVTDLIGNLARSRQYLPFLKRTPRFDAIVEFVVHASRMRVYLPRENCLLSLLLSGIQCPRRDRPKEGVDVEEQFSMEAHNFVKEMCMQRTVEVAVDNIDRIGNFVGWMFIDGPSHDSTTPANESNAVSKKKKKNSEANVKPKTNLSVLLVSKGLATVHRAPSTEASLCYHELIRAEESAKTEKCGLWSSKEFVAQWQTELSEMATTNANQRAENIVLPGGAATSYIDDLSVLNLNGHSEVESSAQPDNVTWIPSQITALSKPAGVSEGLRFFAQHASDSGTIVQISSNLNGQHAPHPIPDYRPKKGDLCAACFSLDDCWYRARVIKQDSKCLTVQFVDFGNEESIPLSDVPARLSPLPPGILLTTPPQAHEYRLACVQMPPDVTDRSVAEHAFANAVMNKEVLLAVRYTSIPCGSESVKPVPAVSLKFTAISFPGSSMTQAWTDVGQLLLGDGLTCVEPMRPDLLKQVPRAVLATYLDSQANAKKERKNIWRYGDFRIDSTA